jgi:hypothetical protein
VALHGLASVTIAAALLVRPDRHIAWCAAEPSADPGVALLTAVRQVLSLNPVSPN